MSQHVRAHVTILVTLLAPVLRLGAQVDTVTLARVVALADSANPALQAARLRADAARERIAPAGTLPDPVISVALMNRPVSGFGTSEPMTMNQLQLSQSVPWPGTLGAARQQQSALADAARFSADEAAAQLVGRVTSVYYQLAFVDRAITIAERTRSLLRDFLEVALARYGVGDGLQQDVLQAQVSVAEQTAEIASLTQQRVTTAARLNALLGRSSTIPIGELQLPDPGVLPTSADTLLVRAMQSRPALQAAAAQVTAADAGIRLARRAAYPDLMLSAAYGQRPQFGDMVSLMVGVSVPLRSGSRQRPLQAEMAAMRASEDADARDLLHDTESRLIELRASAVEARQLSTLYATAILPQARANVESALSAYRVGRVDYQTLVQSQLTVNRYETELVRLSAQFHQALAEIDALTGGRGESR